MVQEENVGEGVDKQAVKLAIKEALSNGMLFHEDQTKGYWWGMQILIECVIELVASGFNEPEKRLEVYEKLFGSVIELQKKGTLYD
jgi:hypothetical protein